MLTFSLDQPDEKCYGGLTRQMHLNSNKFFSCENMSSIEGDLNRTYNPYINMDFTIKMYPGNR